ncbi:nitroreductase family protein [Algoriphagus sediminis]|uniref:Nitroreductase family protein n=1 Tax=Algoriphagus sediminis TaxID=3057113 RepID=A0ABT7YE66_9BACT|nr:nitroreductase family protein [Algoriphagus sediminis]MDN3204761.1 nitroreductase family protein [Algoriphagus sediminis]
MIGKIFRRINSEWDKLVKKKMPFWFYKSGFLAGVYYTVFNPGFRRELKSVLAGKVDHLRNSKDEHANYFMLVRNTHRLEKGLIMRPRKPVFATNYITETNNSYIGVMSSDLVLADSKQTKWFSDVLDEYFSVVESHPVIDKEKDRYLAFRKKLQSDEKPSASSTPYQRDWESFSDISFEEFYKLNRQRRSVRWFLEKPVPRELIDKAITAAIQAPSACNRQPFTYRVLDDPKLVSEAVNLPMGTKGYAHSIQTFIVVVGHLDAYFDERDRHLIYIDASLANMSLMLALETLGLSSCPINWPDIEDREVKMSEFLGLKKYDRPVMCIGVGYPDPEGKVPYSEKRSLEKIRVYN